MSSRIAILVLLLAGLAFAQSAPAKDPGAAGRKKLFKDRFLDHFSWGVAAPEAWLEETRDKHGCRWDFSVHYITSPGPKWEKPYWLNFGNSPEKLVADAKKAGVVPWCTWYMLAACPPACYKPGPAQACPANAKVANTMNEYFTLLKTFLEGAAKGAPWPVMLQIEPDEWCHLLLTAGMDPAKVEVKVGSCGLEDLKGLPDNLIGYAAAIKRLRDRYAPVNVLLGCNPSAWDASGAMSGVKMGQIMKALAGDWDFAVFETGDRDKGQAGKAPPYATAVTVTGSLDAHIKWIAEFRATSGLYVFVWQVAAGNTYFSTCNNTDGHYCDNLLQMLLEDYPQNPTIGRYVQAGCIGWIVMSGQGGGTAVFDAKKDGITNPPAIPGNLGRKSEYADDDGGYMRLRGAAYYKKPYPILKGAPKPPDPSATPTSTNGGQK
jgi:hypothetical protein